MKILVVVLILLLIYMIKENKKIEVETYIVNSDKLPDFTNFRILQISDLHNTRFGENNIDLINRIKECKPDIIVITGDLIDNHHYHKDIAFDFISNIKEIAPVYYITGNHESRIKDYDTIREHLLNNNVKVLEDENTAITKGNSTINLIGLLEVSFKMEERLIKKYGAAYIKNDLDKLCTEQFNLVLSHRPEFFDIYASSKADLVLCGHCHGGQFIIPFIGGLFAPGQGILPKYYKGWHKKSDTTMVISRGLGNSEFPLRFNNNPDLNLIIINFQ